PSKLGKKAELLALFEANRKKIADWVGTLSANDMAKPAPENLRSFLPTVGHVGLLLPGHLNMHIGQIQVLRRKLGKPVMF
ncbi:MAG TPA: DinB family protein, partial [Tepidisphaeraceae bacterium]|nr:DinB family protein [Tepidisphaeraceae bacterium]